MEDTLTPRQFDVLNAIAQYVQDHGFGPTIRALGDLLEIASTSNVYYYLRKFREEGWITYATLGSKRQMIGYMMRLTESGRQALARYRGILHLPVPQARSTEGKEVPHA